MMGKGFVAVWCGLAALAFAGAGCMKGAQRTDESEMEHPLMKRAMEKLRAGNESGAIDVYRMLVEKDPTMARAHLALAFLLDKPDRDYVAAIYHYQRYLQLRPDTEKADMIRSRIRAAHISFVGKAYAGVSNLTDHVNRLERENAALKVHAANLEAQAAHLRSALERARAQVAQAADRSEKNMERMTVPVPAMQPAVRTVKVQQGDTLSKVAARVYGDATRWKDLMEANRPLLKRPEDVRPGQVLVVP